MILSETYFVESVSKNTLRIIKLLKTVFEITFGQIKANIFLI